MESLHTALLLSLADLKCGPSVARKPGFAIDGKNQTFYVQYPNFEVLERKITIKQ